jgi:uncharacterized repeat protein (TIGR01451 family)
MRVIKVLLAGSVPVLVALVLLLLAPAGPSARRAAAQTGPTCGPMDVAFVVDTTGSMGGAINNVKSELAGIFGTIESASGNDYRTALVEVSGENVVFDAKDLVVVDQNFAPNNRAAVEANILALVAGWGANLPEASDEALNTVINALPAAGRQQVGDFTPGFRAGALKIAILVTDAAPGEFLDDYIPGVSDVFAHNVALQAAAAGVKISAIYVPNGDPFEPVIVPVMQDYAAVTGGTYVRTDPFGAGTGAAIRDIIAACGSGDGPDLVVTKEAKPGQPAPVAGGVFSYIIRVKNAGNKPTPPPPTDVMLRDVLPAGSSFVFWTANSGRCTPGIGVVDCVRGRLAPGEEWWVEIRIRVPRAVSAITNRAIVDRWNLIKETNESNNTASLTTLVGP